MPIEDYIRSKVRNLAVQKKRREEHEKNNEKVSANLDKILDAFLKDEINETEFMEFSADIIFANMFGSKWFWDELDLRESEKIEEEEIYSKLSLDEIQKLEPIDLAKYEKEYENKTGLFAE